ncbi:preprotein translocase subunit SecY [Mollicutes bacterium LVI A0039]|nr:preprotein translocase subunit SecY [Mollicutes bacterium LVI A0039]
MQLKQILSSKVTRSAIVYTLMILVIYRLGTFIVAPGTSSYLITASTGTSEGIAGLFDFFGGGSLSQYGLFMLGVSPYISASIVIQLLETDLVPAMSDWKNQGVQGQNKRSNWTKFLAIAFAVIQSTGFILTAALQGMQWSSMLGTDSVFGTTSDFVLMITTITAGVATMMWLADRITEKGIGNGVSVVIMFGIISKMPETFNAIYTEYFKGATELSLNAVMWLIILIIQILLILIVIYYNLAKRKVRINYVRSSQGKVNENSYIPIKLNPAGMIPVIFVTPIMLVPVLVLNWLPLFKDNGIGKIETVFRAMFDQTSSNEYWYVALVVNFILIVLFSMFYSYVQMNPKTMTENLERQGAYIVGVRSGEGTEKYLEQVINKTSFWGGVVLALIASVPMIITQLANVPTNINLSLLGTGLIITVSVIVQTYDALLNKTESKVYRKLFGVR